MRSRRGREGRALHACPAHLPFLLLPAAGLAARDRCCSGAVELGWGLWAWADGQRSSRGFGSERGQTSGKQKGTADRYRKTKITMRRGRVSGSRRLSDARRGHLRQRDFRLPPRLAWLHDIPLAVTELLDQCLAIDTDPDHIRGGES